MPGNDTFRPATGADGGTWTAGRAAAQQIQPAMGTAIANGTAATTAANHPAAATAAPFAIAPVAAISAGHSAPAASQPSLAEAATPAVPAGPGSPAGPAGPALGTVSSSTGPIPLPTILPATSGPAGFETSRIVGQILKAAHRLRAVLNSHLGQFDLNDVRYTVLQIVGDRVDAGCSQTELADELDQSESSISTLVERMRASGLLYRLRSKSDRRKRVLMLTERGRSLLALADEKHREQMSSLLAAFSDAERRRLLELLERLVLAVARPPATIRFDREAA
jgi:DNA-binding MarR family transcriptional regulator